MVKAAVRFFLGRLKGNDKVEFVKELLNEVSEVNDNRCILCGKTLDEPSK